MIELDVAFDFMYELVCSGFELRFCPGLSVRYKLEIKKIGQNNLLRVHDPNRNLILYSCLLAQRLRNNSAYSTRGLTHLEVGRMWELQRVVKAMTRLGSIAARIL